MTSAVTRDEVTDWVRRYQDAWAARDATALAALYAPDAVHDSPAKGECRGRPDIAKNFESWLQAFPDLAFGWDESLIDGDRVVLPWRAEGTMRGAFFGVQGSGKRVEIDGVALLTVTAVGISRARFVYDFSSVLLRLGILKAKPGP